MFALWYQLCWYGSDHMDIFINQRIECYLNNTIKSSLLNSTHYAMLQPQTGDRIVAIDSVTSLHPVYSRRGSRPWGGTGRAARAFHATTAAPGSCGSPRSDTWRSRRRRCCWTTCQTRSVTRDQYTQPRYHVHPWIFLATTCQTMVDVRSVSPVLASGTHFLSISGNQHQ